MPKALKSCQKSKISPNRVTLSLAFFRLFPVFLSNFATNKCKKTLNRLISHALVSSHKPFLNVCVSPQMASVFWTVLKESEFDCFKTHWKALKFSCSNLALKRLCMDHFNRKGNTTLKHGSTYDCNSTICTYLLWWESRVL